MTLTWLRSPQAAFLLAALLLAGGAYFLAHRYLSGQAHAVRERAEAAWATREVVVAAADLPAGERLAAGALALRTVPERYLASDALDRAALGEALGQRLMRPLRAGEVLSRSAVESASSPSIGSLVGPGERAYTLPVDEAASAAGLLAPGDLVDLLFVPQDDGEGGAPRVLPLMEAVPVIATGHSVRRRGGEGEPESYGTITLRVRPEQAQRLMLAQRIGLVSVAVRPSGDEATPAMAPLGREALLGRGVAARAARAPVERATVEFIVGGATGGGPAGGPAVSRRAAGARS